MYPLRDQIWYFLQRMICNAYARSETLEEYIQNKTRDWLQFQLINAMPLSEGIYIHLCRIASDKRLKNPQNIEVNDIRVIRELTNNEFRRFENAASQDEFLTDFLTAYSIS